MSFEIETERLRLRDVREKDIPVLLSQFAEPAAQRSILSSQGNKDYNQRGLENAIAWGRMSPREYYVLAVELRSDKTLIGSCNISNVKPESIETHLGWHYGSKYWGNGYATEAARALLYIGFRLGNVSGIYADCFADNKASVRIMEKIGMHSSWKLRLFNTVRGWSYGERRPAVRYTISKEEFNAALR